MIRKFYKVLLILCCSVSISAIDLHIESVGACEVEACQSLFCKFERSIWSGCCNQQVLEQLLQTTADQELQAYAQHPESMVLLKATFMEETVGYVSCQKKPGYQVHVRQIAVDPEKYDTELIKELLFAIFEFMPQVKKLTIECPALCPDLSDLLQDLGFVRNDQGWAADMVGLFVEYDLIVHSKCEMCKLIYGADFWEQEIDPSDFGDWGSWTLTDDQSVDPIMYTIKEGNDDEGVSPF